MRFLIAFLALLLPVVAWGQPSPGQGHAAITSGTINGAVIGGTTPAPGTFTSLSANTIINGATALRSFLTTTQVLWVVSGGNDNSNCLTYGTACATVQGAVNKAETLFDFGNQLVLIQLAGGSTYTGTTTINGPFVGGGTLWINGSGGQATLTSSSGNTINVLNWANVYLGNVILQNTSGSYGCLAAGAQSNVVLQTGVTFGSCPNGPHIDASGFASVTAAAAYTISGNAVSHLHSHSGGNIGIDNVTVTCTGNPAFSSYFAGASWSYIEAIGTTFSGCSGVTGPRFDANRNAGIRTNTNNLSFFPGNSAGSVESSSVFDDYEIQQRAIASGSSDTASVSDRVIIWKSATASAKTESIPACTSTGPWYLVTVSDGQGTAATYNLTISAPSSTINGAANWVISTNYGAMTVKCDGVSNYVVVNK